MENGDSTVIAQRHLKLGGEYYRPGTALHVPEKLAEQFVADGLATWAGGGGDKAPCPAEEGENLHGDAAGLPQEDSQNGENDDLNPTENGENDDEESA